MTIIITSTNLRCAIWRMKNLCQFYLHIYQMYLFRRCHCIHIIASILSSQPLPSPMMRYVDDPSFFCLSERFLYQRKLMRGCWIFKDLIKNGFCQLSIMSWKHALFDMDINISKLDIAIFQVLFVISLETLCYHNRLLTYPYRKWRLN